MAERYWTGVLGANMPDKVTENGAATPGNAFDFRCTYDATGVTKLDAIKFLRATEEKILSDTWPPV